MTAEEVYFVDQSRHLGRCRTFVPILLNKNDNGRATAQVIGLDDARSPADGEVIRVDYSTMNYEDGPAIMGKAAVVRSWPIAPGVIGDDLQEIRLAATVAVGRSCSPGRGVAGWRSKSMPE